MTFLSFLFVFSACLFAICLLIKVSLHFYLDDSNGRGILYNAFKPWVYLLPYREEIYPNQEGTKKFCNRVQRLLVYLFAFLVVSSALRSIFLNSSFYHYSYIVTSSPPPSNSPPLKSADYVAKHFVLKPFK